MARNQFREISQVRRYARTLVRWYETSFPSSPPTVEDCVRIRPVLFFLSALLLLSSISAFAQPPRRRTIQASTPVGNDAKAVAIGITTLSENYGVGVGVEGDLLVPLSTSQSLTFGGVVDGSFNKFSGFYEATALGGVRIISNASRLFRPFGQFLVGVEYCNICGSTDLSLEPGGGLDLKLSGSNISVRAEAGYRITRADIRTYKEFHFFGGIAFALR